MPSAMTPCTRCKEPIPYLHPLNTDRGLTVALSGSYGEFYDSLDGLLYIELCHACGHALTDLLGIDTIGWHPEREN